MFLKRSGNVLAFLNLLLVAGCSSAGGNNLFPPAGNNTIKIESVPSGAEVYVMGERVGVTPTQINSQDVFPNTYPRSKESEYGRITLKKPGCSDFTRTVSGDISGGGLHAILDCGNDNPASPGTTAEAPRGSDTVEQRLDKVKELLGKGLITEEEAKKARARILNEL
jgi:hypothetical protein